MRCIVGIDAGLPLLKRFGRFLDGANLQECYDACGEVGKRWYEILEQQGGGLEDEELIEYIGEERVISK